MRIVAGPPEALHRGWRETFMHDSTQRRPTKMRKSLKRSYSIASIVLPSLFLACGDSTSPEPDFAAGNYTAVTFVSTGNSGQKDEIAAGSTLVLNLNANGTTSGHLHMAAPGGGPDFDADMAGTWFRAGTTVEINQSADTFVRDMPFELTPNLNSWDLVGDRGFSGTRIQLILRRT
jgi:hypothetical protein